MSALRRFVQTIILALSLSNACYTLHVLAETEISYPLHSPTFTATCGHDAMLQSRLYKPEKEVMRMNATYGERGRRATKSPIRIATDYQFTVMTEAQKDLYMNKIMPAAVSILQELLYVNPVVGNLYVPRSCARRWTSNWKCLEFHPTNTCGSANIPDSYLGMDEICASLPTSCVTLPASTGIPNADIIIYVTDNGSCGSSTLANAFHCSRDQNDRPTSGFANICPLLLTSSYSDHDKIMIMVHEVVHALGFSSSQYAYYRYPDGTPRTPRDYKGDPLKDSVTGKTITASNTLKQYSERGNIVNKIVLPRVIEELAIHSNCATIDGLELENDGGAGTSGSHWESRILNREFMTGSIKINGVISTLTLALLEDSGWYYPDYSKAGTHTWGLKQGCASISEKCIFNGVSASLQMFCAQSGLSCSADRKSYAVCNIEDFQNDLPVENQYFSNPKQGGSKEADYCPVISPIQTYECDNTARNSFPAELFGENFGAGSLCIESSLLNVGYTSSQTGLRPKCFKSSCSVVDGDIQFSVTIDSQTKVCNAVGQQLTFTGYNGYAVCPDPSFICPELGCECPNGKCVEGVCRPFGVML